ncbi:MAG: DUF4416 family protein [Deltaproteobacteria bacterium]|nr:DUF4416 family protein [Deltaproteobacteria bacterium]
MSAPREPDAVRLIANLFSSDRQVIKAVSGEMEVLFGPIDWESPWLLFDRTRYYEREMGWPLHRRFVSFERLIMPEGIVAVKLATNKLESKYVQDGNRKINIDPGYISLERLILATGKNYTHRIYLSKGIYADLTLIFHKGSFRPLDWTYRDYSDPRTIEMFNNERERYKLVIRPKIREPVGPYATDF